MTDLTWPLSSCALIGAVVAIRAAFGKRLRPGLRYALWGLVLLRLLVPVQLFTAPWGVSAALPEQDVYLLPLEQKEHPTSAIVSDGPEGASLLDDMLDDHTQLTGKNDATWTFTRYAAKWSVADVLRIVWLAGAAVTAVVFCVSNLRFSAQLRKRRIPLYADCPLRVYSVECLSSSCLFGNAVYVAAGTNDTQLRHVLAHELSHYRHGDHVWTLLRCVALALHWYNPLVWWAAALSRQDSELCADAGALKRLGEDERENYGATLIELSAQRAPRASLLCTATTMTNGKKSLRERVTMIASRPRMTAAVVIAVVLIATVAAGCAFAGSKAEGLETVRWSGDHDSVDSVTLWSSGREFTAEEPEGVGQVLDAVSSVVFTRGGDANAPGAQSLVATIRYRDGAEERITFPCWERGGVTYDAGTDSIERFAPFFADWPEPQKQSDGADDGGAVTRWEADFDGDGTAERLVLDTRGLVDRSVGGFWLEDLNGNQLRFMGEIAPAHAGWRTVALTELDGKTYLLEYSPAMYQGEATYFYTLGGVRESSFIGGERVEFSANPDGMEKNDRAAMERFQTRANNLWAHSRLLFTTDQEVLAHLYDAEGKPVTSNGSYYIAGEGETVRYFETMYNLLDGEADTLSAAGTPTEEAVLALRERVETGMTDAEIKYLTEMVMVEHYWWEYHYLELKTFEQMRDPDSPLWNNIDQAGEILVGWVIESNGDKAPALCHDNTHDAESFRKRMTALKSSVKSGLLDDDFDRMIALFDQAKETHDVGCVIEVYHMLHDMDYYVLRYGPSAVGSRTIGPSIASVYHSCLQIWQ